MTVASLPRIVNPDLNFVCISIVTVPPESVWLNFWWETVVLCFIFICMGCCSWWSLWFWSLCPRNFDSETYRYVFLHVCWKICLDVIWKWHGGTVTWWWWRGFGTLILMGKPVLNAPSWSKASGEGLLVHKPLSMRSDQDHSKTGTWIQLNSF